MAKVTIDIEAQVAEAQRDISKLEGSINDLEKTTGKMDKANQKTALSLTDLQSGFMLAKEAVQTVQQAYQATVGVFIDYAAQVRDVTAATGLSTEEVSRMIEVADDAGVEVGTLKTALREMGKDGVAPTVDELANLADQFQKIQDPAQRTQFLMDKFGRSGLEMGKLMEQSSDSIRNAAAVMDEDMAKSARNAEIAFDNLDDSVRNIKIRIGSELAPTLVKAADAFELLLTWSDRLDAAIKKHGEDVAKTSATYEDYEKEMRRVAALQGSEALQTLKLMTQAEWEHANAIAAATDESVRAEGRQRKAIEESTEAEVNAYFTAKRLNDVYAARYQALNDNRHATEQISDAQEKLTNNLIAARYAGIAEKYAMVDLTIAEKNYKDTMELLNVSMSGAIKTENKTYLDNQQKLTEEFNKTQAELDKLLGIQGKAYTITVDNTNAQAAADIAARKLAQAQMNLAENTKPDKQYALETSVMSAQLALDKANAAIGRTTTGYIDNSKKIDELKTKLAEEQTALEENAKKHEETSKRIVFGYLQQQMAAANLGPKAGDALMDLAKKWGLVSQADYDAYQSAKQAVGYAASGDWAAYNQQTGKMALGWRDVETQSTYAFHQANASMVAFVTAPEQAAMDAAAAQHAIGFKSIGDEADIQRPRIATFAQTSAMDLKAAASAADAFSYSIRSIPDHKTITIKTIYQEEHYSGGQATGTVGAGMRHSGGPVLAGRPYIIKPDEEVFIPSQSGTIVPSQHINNYNLSISTMNAPSIPAEFGRAQAWAGAL